MFAIKEQQRDGALVIHLSGSLNAETVTSFAEWSSRRDDGSINRLILDCSELTYLSSAGLRAILTTYRHAERNGATLQFCGLNGIVREVFKTAGLLIHLQVFSSVAEAMEFS